MTLASKPSDTQLLHCRPCVENQYNSLPLGYHQHEKAGGTPVLKIICPNHLRMGRVNTRALDGPMRLPKNKEEHPRVVRPMYDA